MAKHQKRSGSGERETRVAEKIPAGQEAQSEEECRCKEVSKKTPREMLKLMARDFTFWKKQKSKKSSHS